MQSDIPDSSSLPADSTDDENEVGISEATIASFIVRFTQEQSLEAKPLIDGWRGVIRHVQSNQQAGFTRMEEALSFISRYVIIGDNK
jgi:hypothetical protein